MSGIEFDFTEITQLAGDLGEVPANAASNVIAALKVTSINIKEAWRDPLTGSDQVPHGAASISFDLSGTADAESGSVVESEIGPVLTGQGPIVGMLEYGTPSTGARGFGAAALEANQADFQRGLEIALRDAEREAGL